MNSACQFRQEFMLPVFNTISSLSFTIPHHVGSHPLISGNPHAIHLLHPAASGLRRLTEVELRKKCRWPIWNRRMLLPLVYGGSKSLRRRHISLYVADGRISQGWRAHQQAFCKTCCMQLAVAIYSGFFRHISMSSKYNQTVWLEWSIAVEYWQHLATSSW